MNTSIAATVVLALAAPATTMAFQPSPASINRRPISVALNSLRDIASYPDDMKMMTEFEAFDRNGAFSRSPQGGYGGRSDNMMYGGGGGGGNPNPFSRRGGGRDYDRMYTRDGFDPYSAYGNSFGMSQSDNRRGGGPRDMMMMGGGPPDMMMGGPPRGGMMMNGVKADNTMGGFDYSSRNRDYGYGMPYGGAGGGGMNMMPPYDYDGGFDGPMGGMGGGEMGYEQGGGYGGFVDGDMSRLGP